MKKAIVLVHPWMWVEDLFEICKQRGVYIISIITPYEKNKINTNYVNEHSDLCLKSDGKINEDYLNISEFLKLNNILPIYVINGLDSSFYYADKISSLLGLSCLATESSLFLNKHKFNENLRIKGIPTIKGILCSSTTLEVDDAEALHQIGYPLLAKPAEDTAAMADVKIIEDEENLIKYLKSTIGKPNKYYSDRVIKSVLVQKYIPPTSQEFFVDYLTVNGVHKLLGAGIYRYDNNKTLTEIDVVSKDQTEIPQSIFEYLISVLDASGIKNGFTHNEVFLTEDDEIFLVESNPRHCGQPGATLYRELYGRHSFEVLFNILDGHSFDGYSLNIKALKNTRAVFLYNFFVEYPKKLNIDDISSDVKVISFRGAGKKNIESDFYLSPERAEQIAAILMISNKDENLLLQDSMILREREKNGTLFSH